MICQRYAQTPGTTMLHHHPDLLHLKCSMEESLKVNFVSYLKKWSRTPTLTCIKNFISLSGNRFWSPIKRSITCFKSDRPSISSPSKSIEWSYKFNFSISTRTKKKNFTENSKCMFCFDGLWSCFTKYRHHVQEVFKCAVSIIARTEHFAYSITEWIHPQFRIF